MILIFVLQGKEIKLSYLLREEHLKGHFNSSSPVIRSAHTVCKFWTCYLIHCYCVTESPSLIISSQILN
jgi:hypothetical protein